MTKDDLNVYAMRVSQASKTEIVVIMYEVAIQYMKESVCELECGNISKFREYLKKSKAFINELASSLDMKFDISVQLLNLYTYFNNACVKADIRCEKDELVRIIEMLEKLKKSFEEVAKMDNSGPVMKNTQQIYAGLTYSRNGFNENYTDVKSYNRGIKI